MGRPRKAAERAIALGEDDPAPYALAFELGWSHSAVLALPNEEYLRMQAYLTVRAGMRAHAAAVAAARSGP